MLWLCSSPQLPGSYLTSKASGPWFLSRIIIVIYFGLFVLIQLFMQLTLLELKCFLLPDLVLILEEQF